MRHDIRRDLLIFYCWLFALLCLATPTLAQQPVTPKIVEGTQVQPVYPDSARRLGIQGTTTLHVLVFADGHVAEVGLVQSAGHPDLDQAAADAVRRWRFEPARRGRDAVPMTVMLAITFRLDAPAGPALPPAPGPLSRMWGTMTPGKAGVVGALDGVVNAQRVGRQGPVPLKVWDDVFLQDRIASGDGARIEVALGDKMHLAMRERTVITISETPGRATVDLDAGEITIAMRGDRSLLDGIEVRTPHVIATGRGGTRMRVVVTRAANSPGVVAHVDVLDGSVTVAIHPDLNNPLYRGVPSDIEVRENQGITISGEVPGPIRPIRTLDPARK